MKRLMSAGIVLMSCAVLLSAQAGGSAPPYLGQALPDTTPRVFAPGIVSTGNIHSRLVEAPGGREFFWNTVDMKAFTTRLMHVRVVGATWSAPRTPGFAEGQSAQGPAFSPDGARFCYTVRRPQGSVSMVVDRVGVDWGTPREVAGTPPCAGSVTRAGRAYFSSTLPGKTWNSGIFSGSFTASGLSDLVALDPGINVPNAIDYTPFVSPDETFLLFSSNRPATGDVEDLHVYVSFRTRDGRWGTPRRVSEIPARFPSLSRDGRLLFFCGDDGNIYWADVKILDALR